MLVIIFAWFLCCFDDSRSLFGDLVLAVRDAHYVYGILILVIKTNGSESHGQVKEKHTPQNKIQPLYVRILQVRMLYKFGPPVTIPACL